MPFPFCGCRTALLAEADGRPARWSDGHLKLSWVSGSQVMEAELNSTVSVGGGHREPPRAPVSEPRGRGRRCCPACRPEPEFPRWAAGAGARGGSRGGRRHLTLAQAGAGGGCAAGWGLALPCSEGPAAHLGVFSEVRTSPPPLRCKGCCRRLDDVHVFSS